MTGKHRILLIKPTDEADFLNSSVANESMGKAALLPSSSLVTVAGMTPRERFEVEILDECLGTRVEEAHIEADIYGLTCFDPSRHRAHEICRWLKDRGGFVVIGGPHATQHYESILAEQPYDAVFAGDAELTWPRFLAEWQRGHHERLYLETERVSLDHTPVARWDLVSADHYLTAVVQTSRGCPYKCEFCDSIVLAGNKVRTRPVERVMEEIDQVYRLGFSSVLIGDDNFTASRRYAKEVLRRIAEWRADKDPLFMVAAQVSIDVARDDELCELMVRSGLVFAYIGVESSSKAALEGVRKTQNVRSDIPADLEKLHRYGINVMSGLIVGFDEDGPDIFGSHVDYLNQLAIPVCPSYLLMAPAGTPLRERLEREGRIDGDFVSEDLHVTNIIPKRMSRADLLKGYRWMTTQLFDADGFAKRLDAKFKIFRTKGIKPNGTMSLAIRLRRARMALAILGYCARRPRAAREMVEPLRKILPTMLARPRFIMDSFNDLLMFIRFKSYYERAGVYRKELMGTPRPETWMVPLEDEADAPIGAEPFPRSEASERTGVAGSAARRM